MNILLANLLAGAKRPGGPVVPPVTDPMPPAGGIHGPVPPGQPMPPWMGVYPPGTIANNSHHPAVHQMASASNQELLASLARAKTVAVALQHLRKLRPYTPDGSLRPPAGY